MQFLRTLFWVVLAVAAVIFAMRNWTTATVNLWGGLLVEVKLPVLIFGAFLLGFLPTFGYHRATRWRLRRRLESHERALAEIRTVTETPPSVSTTTITDPVSTIEPPAQS